MLSLQLLIHFRHPTAEYFELWYRHCIRTLLVDLWYLMQGGTNGEACHLWLRACKVLELDRKAKMELFLLLQQGKKGRAVGNKMMWHLLTDQALRKPYRNLSMLVSNQIKWKRQAIDRPGRQMEDLKWWTWECYWDLEYGNLHEWAAAGAPNSEGTYEWEIVTGPGGVPLPPPRCYGWWDARGNMCFRRAQTKALSQ